MDESHDRITELYECEVGTLAEQRLAAARIHWMTSHVEGPTVLDVGCGQGIAALLLAREGHRAVGVDRDPDVIEWAQRHLRREAGPTRARISFQCAEAGDLPFPDEHFDNVLLGRVLEGQVNPGPILDEALRVLKPGGRVVISSLYGELRAPPFGEPLFLKGQIELLAPRIDVDDLALLDRYLAIAGTATPDGAPAPSSETWARALDVAERRLAGVLESSVTVEGLRAELAAITAHQRDLDVELAEKVSELTEKASELTEARERLARTSADRDALQRGNERAEQRLAHADGLIRELDQKLGALTSELERERTTLRGALTQASYRLARSEAEQAAVTRELSALVSQAQQRERSRLGAGTVRTAAEPTATARPRRRGLSVLHLLARSLPHGPSAVAIDRHALLRAQQQAGLETAVMTDLVLPSDGGIEDPPSCEFIDGIPYYRLHAPERDECTDRLVCATRLGEELLGVLEPQILHVASLEVAPLGVALALRHSLPLIVELGSEVGDDNELDRELLAAAEHVVALSQRQRERALRAGVEGDRIALIPGFVDMSRFTARRRARASKSPPVLGTVTYRPHSPAPEAVRDLLRAATEPVEGLIVRVFNGLEPTEPAAAITPELRQVKAGVEQVASWLAQMDVVVAATPHEALDAMAAARCVVGIGAAAEVAPAIDEVASLLSDSRLRRRQGVAARKQIVANNTDAALESYDRLYAETGRS